MRLTVALLNGAKESHQLLSSRALAYGDGLFETIAYANGSLRLWDRHMARLRGGCERLGLDFPDCHSLEREALSQIGTRNRGIIKIIMVRSTEHRGYSPIPSTGVDRIVQAYDWPNLDARWGSGIKLGLCEICLSENPATAGMKHLNRLEQVLASKEVVENGWDEGLMCNQKAQIVSGTKSNLFAIRENVIFTSALKTCGVAGVMRENVLTIAKELGLAVKYRDVSVSNLEEATGIFITNALIGVAPVREFHATKQPGRRPFVYPDNEITKTLTAAVKK